MHALDLRTRDAGLHHGSYVEHCIKTTGINCFVLCVPLPGTPVDFALLNKQTLGLLPQGNKSGYIRFQDAAMALAVLEEFAGVAEEERKVAGCKGLLRAVEGDEELQYHKRVSHHHPVTAYWPVVRVKALALLLFFNVREVITLVRSCSYTNLSTHQSGSARN